MTAVEQALSGRNACLPPVVLTEVLSDPRLPPRLADALRRIPLLALMDGYWERAGLLRARVLAGQRKARVADSLIAQSCLDHDVALITRDADFRGFAQAAGLRLAP